MRNITKFMMPLVFLTIATTASAQEESGGFSSLLEGISKSVDGFFNNYLG